ncbi:hypothetical protein ERX37_09605 [Macrococcus hajekii]|uniref:Hemerythrin-like domain-containing protein n=1 Tax=Macrococcus hajekii TaxID=198482 RepID=A0A4R6BIF3_9STAP|nr:DUF3916 domain-containing protein [Macrococcus hajekii]TDM01357.1 hypothetical protein ERX37_09605 [Macrococcus hajekii]GGB10949.1 hypothetical protein GCM10007190_18790 [Macrococcus hajekii]
MTGPSLKQLQAHRQIHDTGLALAVEMTDDLVMMLRDNDEKQIVTQIVELVEFWESRVISHADAEEEEDGFYAEMAAKSADMKEKVIALKRDHQLLRDLVTKIKSQMEEEGFSTQIIDYFRTLIIVNEMHSRDEERFLLQ